MLRSGNLYICNRCDTERFVESHDHNGTLPSDWISLLIQGELTVHMCPECYAKFKDFMNNRGDVK